MPKKKYNLALVLSGGGAPGMAHIGVIKTLEKNNITPDIIVGTSSGAIVGGMHSAGVLNDFENFLTGKTKKELSKKFSFWPSKEGLINTGKLENDFRKFIGNKKIEELNKKFIAVSVDLLTGKMIFIDKGDLCQSILASIAVPILFVPIHRDGMLLVDGGLEDPLAIDEGFKLAKKVIAVNTTRHIDDIQKKEKYGFIDIFERSLAILQTEIVAVALKKYKHNLVVISPHVDMNLLDFHRADEAVKIGEDETTKRIEDIKKLVLE